MPAAINTAALLYQQYTSELDLTDYTPLPATIVGLEAGGNRVDIVVKKTIGLAQTPDGEWTQNHVPYVDTGAAQPLTGPFVTPTGWTPPAPPAPQVPPVQNLSGFDSAGAEA